MCVSVCSSVYIYTFGWAHVCMCIYIYIYIIYIERERVLFFCLFCLLFLFCLVFVACFDFSLIRKELVSYVCSCASLELCLMSEGLANTSPGASWGP